MDWRERYDRLRTEAHLYWAEATEPLPPETGSACRALLSPEERAQGDRLRRPEARQAYLLGHTLLRIALSRYRALPPTEWAFVSGPRGRPELADPAEDLRFNLSHTRGLAACVVTRTCDCGVDVEQIRRADQRLERAARLLSPTEAEALGELPLALRRRRFFVHWTLAEAYLKARGIGLGVEVDQVRFTVHEGGIATAWLGPELEDRPSDWQFAWAEPTDHHALALALRVGGQPRRLRCWQATPIDLGRGRCGETVSLPGWQV